MPNWELSIAESGLYRNVAISLTFKTQALELNKSIDKSAWRAEYGQRWRIMY